MFEMLNKTLYSYLINNNILIFSHIMTISIGNIGEKYENILY